MITTANVFRLLGFNAAIVSFRGHGYGSSGWTTDIGFHSALDLAVTLEKLKKLHPRDTFSYLGHSMGAAALMLYPQALQREAHPDSIKKKIKKGGLFKS